MVGRKVTKRRVATAVVVVLAAVCAWLLLRDEAAPLPSPSGSPREAETSAPSQPARERPRRGADAAPADATAAPDAAKPPERAFVVTVVSAADGRPVEGALVRTVRWDGDDSMRAENTTGPDGVAEFDAVPTRVIVRKPGFCVARSVVKSSGVKEHRVELTPGIAVRGRVVFADSRAPAVGVQVRPWMSRRLSDKSVDTYKVEWADERLTTDEDGRFELAGLPPGEQVTVYAATPGYRTVDTTITRTAPGPDIELVLGDGGILEGTVYDEDGKPMPGTDVYLLPVGDDPPDPEWVTDDETLPTFELRAFLFPATPTDDAGRYEFKGVRLPIGGVPQPRLVAARDAKGRVARSEPATFARHGERMQRDIRFTRSASIVVRVTSAAPLPKGTQIKVQRNGPIRMGDAERELAEGATTETFEGLGLGLYFVSVEAGDRIYGGGFEVMREVSVADGERAEVEFAVGGDRRIAGTVVDSSGKPVGGLALKFETGERSSGSFEAWTKTRADGAFAFDGLAPSPGTVELDDMMFHMRVMASGDDADGSFAKLRVQSVTPGGAALRLVVQRPARVTGRLVPAPASTDGVEFLFAGDEDWSNAQLQIGDEGRFTCEVGVVDRPLDLYFKCKDCAPAVFANRTLAPGATLDVGEVRFEPGLTFEGRLVDAGGKPLVRAELYATDPWMDRRLETDADGKFRLEQLPRMPVHVKVDETPGTATWRLTFDAASLRGEFTIGAGVSIAGRVLRADGEPARKARLQLLPAAAGRAEHAGAVYPTTDDDGRFTVRVQPGKFRVVAYGGRAAPAVEPSSFEASADGPNPPLELRLR